MSIFSKFSNSVGTAADTDYLRNTVSWLTSAAPWMNLIVPCGLVILIGYFHYSHLSTVFEKPLGYTGAQIVSVSIWVLIAAVRITLLFATTYDFKQRDYMEGTLGMVASVIVLFFDLWFIGVICQSMFPKDANEIASILKFLSILAVVLEIRLVLMLLDSSKARAQKNIKYQQSASGNGSGNALNMTGSFRHNTP